MRTANLPSKALEDNGNGALPPKKRKCEDLDRGALADDDTPACQLSLLTGRNENLQDSQANSEDFGAVLAADEALARKLQEEENVSPNVQQH